MHFKHMFFLNLFWIFFLKIFHTFGLVWNFPPFFWTGSLMSHALRAVRGHWAIFTLTIIYSIISNTLGWRTLRACCPAPGPACAEDTRPWMSTSLGSGSPGTPSRPRPGTASGSPSSSPCRVRRGGADG